MVETIFPHLILNIISLGISDSITLLTNAVSFVISSRWLFSSMLPLASKRANSTKEDIRPAFGMVFHLIPFPMIHWDVSFDPCVSVPTLDDVGFIVLPAWHRL